MIPVWIVLAILAYAIVGAIFARYMAISTGAVIVLVLLWPIFAVLIIAAPVINHFANRNLP
jgi:VIT1/CCC1 family predicted Fe2+/Mn2+ transporter